MIDQAKTKSIISSMKSTYIEVSLLNSHDKCGKRRKSNNKGSLH